MASRKLVYAIGIFSCVATCFFAWQYFHKGVLIDDSVLSGKCESVIDEILTRYNIQDYHVLKTIRRERKRMFPIPTLWIETNREIAFQPKRRVSAISDELKQVADQFNMNVFTILSQTQRTIIELGKKDRIYQRLIFKFPDIGDKKNKQLAAIVIDDVGGRKSDLESMSDFFALGIPITYAVLPSGKLSRTLTELIHRHGDEIILHQPMEPEDMSQNNPGDASLFVKMDQAEIEGKLKKNMENVPYAIGISNHMGSRFTGDPGAMRSLFESLKNIKGNQQLNPFFFFDSHTNPKPVGSKLSVESGLSYLRNDLFLDHEDNLDLILNQIKLMQRYAKKNRVVIVIGHVQRKYTAEALRRTIPGLMRDGIIFVHLSDLLVRDNGTVVVTTKSTE